MTCTLFSYICENMRNNKRYSLNKVFTLNSTFWKFSTFNNINKFVEFYKYINSDPEKTFLYDRNGYIDNFCMIQKYYFALIKLKNIVKHKYYKRYDYNQDLIGNNLNDMKKKHKINLIENNTLYSYSLKDLLKTINIALLSNEGFFFSPKIPHNPYTGLQFSKHNLYNIYFAYKNTNLPIILSFEHYFLSEFSIKNFKKSSEGILNNLMIDLNVKNFTNNDIIIWIKKMFKLYKKTPPYISKDFPKDKIREIFIPYLQLWFYIKYGRDESRVFWSKRLLKQQIIRFCNYMKKHNPAFGRVIVIMKKNKITGKYSSVKQVKDDFVRWDPHFPRINETKILNETFTNINYNSDTSVAPLDDSDDEDSVSSYENNNDSYVRLWDNETPQIRFHPATPDTSPPRTPPLIHPVWDQTPPTPINNERSPTPIINESISEITDISLNIIPRGYSLESITGSLDNLSVDDTSTPIHNNTFINDMNYFNLVQNTDPYVPVSNEDPEITNQYELTEALNNNTNVINGLHSNIIRNSLLTRFLQLRVAALESSQPNNRDMFVYLNEIVESKLASLAGKLLIKYIGRNISSEVLDSLQNNIISLHSESNDNSYNRFVSQLQELNSSITIDSSNPDT